MSSTISKILVADFETTVYEGQDRTDVWASAIVEIGTEDVVLLGSIDATFDYLFSLGCNAIVYYHNVKFDGSFWLDYLMKVKKFQQAITGKGKERRWQKNRDMYNRSFKFTCSDRGQWYTFTIKYKNRIIELRDSAKILPMSVRDMHKAFETKHHKLDMEYKGFRYPNCPISEKEKEYIKNDVLVVKEALEFMFSQGYDRLTVGSCALNEFKSKPIFGTYEYDELFPSLTEYTAPPILSKELVFIRDDMTELEKEKAKIVNADKWIRKSYKGGWCYLVKGKENHVYNKGITADVNSLYPSVMHSALGKKYPVGAPNFWEGNYIPNDALKDDRYYFIKIKTRFYIKDGYLPCIQIKDNLLYRPTEWLETSDVYDAEADEYFSHYSDGNGGYRDTKVLLTLTMTDYELIKEHYELVDCEILGGCWFYAYVGLFDEYIDKFMEIKMNSTGAMRTLAKLFLNALYGKLAAKDDSSFKVAYLDENNQIKFDYVEAHDKKPGHIACGSAVTSYAREFTIRHAQKNYHGKDKPGFIYADTDSIHCDLSPEELVDIKVHPNALGCWKLEATWDEGVFIRQKTYIEHVIAEDLKPVEEPYYSITCAGMPERSKWIFDLSLRGAADPEGYEDKYTKEWKNWDKDKYEFLFDHEGKVRKRELSDFRVGLTVPGNLRQKRIDGGILLVEEPYRMRPKR